MTTYTIKNDEKTGLRLLNEQGEEVSALEILRQSEPHRVFAFDGQMGAGKTTFIKKLCEEMGTMDVVTVLPSLSSMCMMWNNPTAARCIISTATG